MTGGRVRVGRRVHSGRLHVVKTSNTRLNIVSTTRTRELTSSTNLSLIGVTPATIPPIYHVVSCNGCHFRRTGGRGRTHGGRRIISVGRIHLNLGASVNSFGAGIGRTVGFLRRNSGMGIGVHFHNHRVNRPRVNLRSVHHFTRTYTRRTAIRGTTGLRNHGVLVFLITGGTG